MLILPKRVAASHRYRRILRPRLKTVAQYALSLFRPVGRKQLLFVSGVQRSGTTLILEIIEQSPRARVFHEGSRAAFRRFMMRETSTIRRLYERSPAALVALKALHEAHRLPTLLDDISDAKAIWIYRRYDDVVRSTLRKWPGGRNQIDVIVTDSTAGEWRGLGMSPATHATLRRHYRSDIDDATAQALFWWWRNELVFDLRLAEDERVLILSYETLLRDSPGAVRAICDFVGLEPQPSMAALVKCEGITRADLPIDPAVRALCDEQLRRLDALAGRPISARPATVDQVAVCAA